VGSRKSLEFGLSFAIVAYSLAQQSLQVQVSRWLEVRQVSHEVIFTHDAARRSAQVGDRLQAVGDSIKTGKNSSATLWVDTGIGVVEVAEQTTLRLRTLAIAPDNGRITRLDVLAGNARLRVRPFTKEGSKLEIQTPVGLSGVRGTVFGVAVQPNGKTGLAVSQGAVNSTAQGKAVAVPNGFQNFTLPGEAPSTPVKLTNDTSMRYAFEKIIEGNVRKVRLSGQVDPVNSVIVDGVPQVTDRTGKFRADLRLVPSYLKIQVVVMTPLGKQETYGLALQ
jgi:FecR protein